MKAPNMTAAETRQLVLDTLAAIAPEADYPSLSTLDGAVAYLRREPPAPATA